VHGLLLCFDVHGDVHHLYSVRVAPYGIATVTAHLPEASTGRIEANGLELAWRQWHPRAPGDPLVLIHGVAGSGGRWQAVADALPDRRLIAIDARGHGRSDWDPVERYDAASHFADVATVLPRLAVDRYAVCGFSMGGGIAILLAAAFPEAVTKLIVVDAYPAPEMTPGSRRVARWLASAGAALPGFDPAIARQFREQLARPDPRREDLWSMWESLACPVLLVRGASSDVLPEALAGEMLRRQPGATLVTVPGVGHGVPHEAPAALAELVQQFLGS
jgi:pimeloyl-ACP methyl ester carboxylesterase